MSNRNDRALNEVLNNYRTKQTGPLGLLLILGPVCSQIPRPDEFFSWDSSSIKKPTPLPPPPPITSRRFSPQHTLNSISLRPHLIGDHIKTVLMQLEGLCAYSFSLLFSLPGVLLPLFLVLMAASWWWPWDSCMLSNKVIHYEISTFLATGQLSGFQFFATVIITAKYIKLYASCDFNC